MALRLSSSTSNDRLLKLGVHNTFEELTEAIFTAQVSRLSNSEAGIPIKPNPNYTPYRGFPRFFYPTLQPQHTPHPQEHAP